MFCIYSKPFVLICICMMNTDYYYNSKCGRKMMKVTIIIRNVTANFTKLQSNFTKNPSNVTALKKIAAIFKKLPSYL